MFIGLKSEGRTLVVGTLVLSRAMGGRSHELVLQQRRQQQPHCQLEPRGRWHLVTS